MSPKHISMIHNKKKKVEILGEEGQKRVRKTGIQRGRQIDRGQPLREVATTKSLCDN
jgi:hypothetical protein